ncbi:MAG: hypothetical protein ACK4PC_12865, partial [Sphingopyxis sp.]
MPTIADADKRGESGGQRLLISSSPPPRDPGDAPDGAAPLAPSSSSASASASTPAPGTPPPPQVKNPRSPVANMTKEEVEEYKRQAA